MLVTGDRVRNNFVYGIDELKYKGVFVPDASLYID